MTLMLSVPMLSAIIFQVFYHCTTTGQVISGKSLGISRPWAWNQMADHTYFRLTQTGAEWKAMVTERMRRVLKDHSEFQSLSDADQDFLWRKNCMRSAIVAMGRLMIAKSGKQQFQLFMGVISSEDKTWEDRFKGFVDLDNLQTALTQKHKDNFRKLDNSSAMYLVQLLKDVSAILGDDQTFQLLVLLALVNTDNLPPTPAFQSIFQLRSIYLKFFQKKFQESNFDSADNSNFGIALNKVKILANLLENYIFRPNEDE